MLPFEDNAVTLVTGASQSGKSVWCHRLCQHSKVMFHTPVEKIIYCYKHYQDSFTALQNQVDDITFSPSIPTESQFEELLKDSRHSLVVLDDSLEEFVADNEICRALATRLAHHLKTSVVFCTQSGQLPGKYGSLISKNVHNSVVLRSPKESYFLRQLGVQLGEHKLLKSAYNDATKDAPFSYLCIALHPKREQNLRYSTNIFPDDHVTFVYK